MRGRTRPLLLLPGSPLEFPSPENFDDEGLLAVGGDLSVERLLLAYRRGIFAWYEEGLPPLWWSPNPRGVMDWEHAHVSRSMKRVLAKPPFELTYNRAFRTVMEECGKERTSGTWIIPEMVEAYTRLFELGYAHSVEVWANDELVGGLYGAQQGALFAAESMFFRTTNASKFALLSCLRDTFEAGIEVFDVQFVTPHLASLGAYAITRSEYLQKVNVACKKAVPLAEHFAKKSKK